MGRVRIITKNLAFEGKIEILSKNQVLPPPFDIKGPIRLRIISTLETAKEGSVCGMMVW